MSVSLITTALLKAGEWLLDKGIDLLIEYKKEQKEKLKAIFEELSKTILSTAEKLRAGEYPAYHCEMMRLLHKDLTETIGSKKEFVEFLDLLHGAIEIERVYAEMSGDNKMENLSSLEKAAAAFKVASLTKF